jgi:hypothetical protein
MSLISGVLLVAARMSAKMDTGKTALSAGVVTDIVLLGIY